MQTTLHAIATANPTFKLPQSEACQFMMQVEGLSQALRRRIPAIYASSEIDRRYSCIPDYGSNPEQFQFYPNNWDLSPFPTTADRNQFYTQQATSLAVHACRDALIQSPYVAEDITHLIVVSCTGFSAPGVDIQIIQQLNLCSTVARTLIGFMGCHGALNGLKVAHDICQANPLARVLMVCVELCTLHFQIEDSIESVVTNALFSDGSAAVVLSSESGPEKSLHYRSGHSLVMPDSQSLMSWTIGNTGFLMGLSPQVPDRIGANISRYIDTVLDSYHLSRSDLAFWAVHPGGIQIVKQVQTALDLAQSQLQDSYDVLRDYGNMSSPTILFILKRILDRLSQDDLRQDDLSKPQLGSAMAFGPGLTIECALFEVS
jgi:alpha-pyrone synthase